MTPSVVALVPMRHMSERVPGKNYRSFGGVPLYHHIVRSLLAVPAVEEVVIDTDSPTIRDGCALEFPERVRVVERPEHLRDGTIPMNEVLLHDVDQTPGVEWFLQTHSTNPLLTPATVGRALEALFATLDTHDSLFSVTRLQTRLWWGPGRPVNHDPEVLLRTQDLPPVFEENSNLYVFRAADLRRRHNRIGERPLLFEIDAQEAWDIDDELDFVVAESLWRVRNG